MVSAGHERTVSKKRKLNNWWIVGKQKRPLTCCPKLVFKTLYHIFFSFSLEIFITNKNKSIIIVWSKEFPVSGFGYSRFCHSSGSYLPVGCRTPCVAQRSCFAALVTSEPDRHRCDSLLRPRWWGAAWVRTGERGVAGRCRSTHGSQELGQFWSVGDSGMDGWTVDFTARLRGGVRIGGPKLGGPEVDFKRSVLTAAVGRDVLLRCRGPMRPQQWPRHCLPRSHLPRKAGW